MNKSYLTHYKNKYPGGRVEHSEDKLDVYDADGDHRIALRKNGAGMMQDIGDDVGASDSHDLSPIPKDARVYKLYADGKVKPSEEAKERQASVEKLVRDGKILSIAEYQKLGLAFDEAGRVTSWPQAKVAAPAPAATQE